MTKPSYEYLYVKVDMLQRERDVLMNVLKLTLDALEHCARLPIVEQAEDEAREAIAKLSQE